MKKMSILSLLVALIMILSACTSAFVGSIESVPANQVETVFESDTNSASAGQATQSAQSTAALIAQEYDAEDLKTDASGSLLTYITLEGETIIVEGEGAHVDGRRVSITSAGTYSISGVLYDGQIIVDAADEDKVILLLNGAEIHCSNSAPIYMRNADKTVITLADGTQNSVSDGTVYVFEDGEVDEPNAAIFSKDDLTINGTGALTVNANYNNGIASKDDLKITGGEITVNAVNDGIKGRNSIAIKDGLITVSAGGDGLQSNNDEEAEVGNILIEGGNLTITAGLDGIQAESKLAISAGQITILSGGGSANSSNQAGWGEWGTQNNNLEGDGTSAKGLKAGVDITISGGTVIGDSTDDAIHSNGTLAITGGELLLASGDDGVHADTSLAINGGTLDITQSYEGIESATITITNGNLHINASDDGINTAGGNDGSAVNGRPGQNNFTLGGAYNLYLNGGYIYVNAQGDGIDVNGSIEMSAGTVIVNGPTNNGNGALDYLGEFKISGGFLVAAGSSGMAQAPSASSSQYSLLYNFQSLQAAGTLFHLQAENGEEVLTFAPLKDYQSVVVSSPTLSNETTYLVFSTGSSSGSNTDGLYTGGSYSPGTQVASFTMSGMVTAVGASGGGFMGGPGRGGGPRP